MPRLRGHKFRKKVVIQQILFQTKGKLIFCFVSFSVSSANIAYTPCFAHRYTGTIGADRPAYAPMK